MFVFDFIHWMFKIYQTFYLSPHIIYYMFEIYLTFINLLISRHIMKERQRKKQLEEAEFKEEQLRKEREASQISTLGETREQIQRVDNQLIDLKNKKQQLFLQLKKLLVNEDVSKRQRKEAP